MHKLFLPIIVLLCMPLTYGATVHGDIYDFSLEKVPGARVSVNTTPVQYYISTEGKYSFEIPNGHYTITAQLIEDDAILAEERKNITIKQQGNYVLDLILFPNLDSDKELWDEPELNFEDPSKPAFWYFAIGIMLVILISMVIYWYNRSRGKEIKKTSARPDQSKNDLDELVHIIRQEGGRTTQKDIRKRMPLSEAKISLMIAELEHKGFIEKIKKGRGNIIVLKTK